MSNYTIQVDQFLLNKLNPEVDRLNLSLASMEEYGYNSRSISDTRSKLNMLITYQDFLREYAEGNEELDYSELQTILKQVGEYKTSMKSRDRVVQSVRTTEELNLDFECKRFYRIYMNDEILKSKVIPPLVDPVDFKIYGPESTTSITVVMTTTGTPPVTYYGIDHVTISDVELDVIDGVRFEITIKNACGDTLSYTEEMEVQDVSCSAGIYWVGATIDRFSIVDTDINESTNITINPNQGTAVGGTVLDYTWVSTDSDMEQFIWRETVTQTVEVEAGDAHAILLLPTTISISDVNELVNGTPVSMTEGLHYDSFSVTSSSLKQYNCYYFRDLTDFVFPSRTFQFTLTQS